MYALSSKSGLELFRFALVLGDLRWNDPIDTLVLPHINYCILSWGSQIDRIHLLQKRAIRNISKSNFRAHTEPLFKEHNLLKVQDIYS